MGTRAQAFIGNPHDYDRRRYLGSVAYDGYLVPPLVARATTAEEFEVIWLEYARQQDHYCPPDRPYPFPWADDIFISDITVAWFQPAGHPLGAYRDVTIYGERDMAEFLDFPPWPGGRKKAAWVLCSEYIKLKAYYERANKRVERLIQNRIDEIPGYDHFTTDAQYHNCAEFQAEAKRIREEFKPNFERISEEYDRRDIAMRKAGAPIPGPARAHSAYVRQPEADSIMLLTIG